MNVRLVRVSNTLVHYRSSLRRPLSSAIMKVALILIAVATTFAFGEVVGEASNLRKAQDESRSLTSGLDDYIFFISNIRENEKWCLTATQPNAHGNLGFRRCDIDGRPPNQLWKLESNGLLRSGVPTSSGDAYCATIGFGHEIFDGVRIRLGPCNVSSSYNKFSWNSNDFHLKTQNQGYCVTNRGPNPNDSDSVLAYQQCLDRGDYKWNVGSGVPPTPAPTPATVGCPATQESGGQGFYEFNIEMNQSSGTVDVWYDMQNVPDSLVITYEGAVIYTTGGLVSGTSSFEVTFGSQTSTSTIVTATLEAPEEGTIWDIFIGCPK